MKFEVGSKVRIKEGLTIGEYERENNSSLDFVEDMDEYVGLDATITHVDERTGNYELDADDGEFYWSIGMLEHFEFKPKFELGDKVKLTSTIGVPDCVEVGDIATIVCVPTYENGFYEIETDKDGCKWVADDTDLEPIEPSLKFKVGDRVKVKEDLVRKRRYPNNKGRFVTFVDLMEKYRGEEATIARITSTDFYGLDIDGGFWSWSCDMLDSIEEVKEVEGVEEMKKINDYEVGTRVSVLSTLGVPHRVSIGDTGVLVSKMSKNEYIIQMDRDNRTWFVYGDDLKLISEPKSTVVESSNTVTITNDSLATYIRVGDVTIAVPVSCPMGYSRKHPDDDYNPTIGEGIALKRMLDDGGKKGLF